MVSTRPRRTTVCSYPPITRLISHCFSSRFVALKIFVAEATATSHEVQALVHLSNDDSHPGREHVVQLLDHFQIHGPNGIHDVVVTEVLCPLLSMKGLPIYKRMKRSFCQQTILGVAYLHSRGVAHGGTRNLFDFGFSVQRLEEYVPRCATPHGGGNYTVERDKSNKRRIQSYLAAED